ncbi:sulfatase-like hydrolase/transferase [Ahrensia sp. 13_GOM-1096m]|uniref:sulfatase-like hydrolase/transferase n=1 Tax=Ahrensia sp. 13_GOM-1096m TaxID=1380380 RepID=UPI00047CF91B|nr:sulfatase-like hydrolase/transferase [Ahrensia sp. 13_GOM-1096m]
MMRNFIIASSIIKFILVAAIMGVITAALYFYVSPDFPIYSYVVFFYTVVLALLFRIYLSGETTTRRRFAYLSIPALMFAFWATVHTLFEDYNVQALIYHSVYGFTSEGIPKQYFLFGLFCLIGVLIIIAAMIMGVRQSPLFSKIDKFAFVPLIVFNPFVIETAQGLGLGAGEQQSLPAYYHPAVNIRHDGSDRPNVIHIFLESAEQTLENEEYFGPVMQPLLEFKTKGLSATNISQVKNTEWTIAGTIAATCGVPLIQPWLTTRNADHIQGRFMPNITCLGDVLKSDGYHTEYMIGADVRFAGTDLFARDHGFENVMGLQELYKYYPNERNEWGLSDQAIFIHAEKSFRKLSKKDQPVLLTLATIGGHPPSGYPSAGCLDGTIAIKSTEPMGIGLECANALTRDMLHSLDADGLLENTIVIIQSDHLMMGSDFTSRLNKLERRNFFMAFGPNIKPEEIDRSASMMDVYPTILEMLGYELPEGAAALGVSLYSDKKNLMEQLGQEELNQAIQFDADLRRLLWLDHDVGSDS